MQVAVYERGGRRQREALGVVEQGGKLGDRCGDADSLELLEPLSGAGNADLRVGAPERIAEEVHSCDGGGSALVQCAQKPSERSRELQTLPV
jgi:hypothetical protein